MMYSLLSVRKWDFFDIWKHGLFDLWEFVIKHFLKIHGYFYFLCESAFLMYENVSYFMWGNVLMYGIFFKCKEMCIWCVEMIVASRTIDFSCMERKSCWWNHPQFSFPDHDPTSNIEVLDLTHDTAKQKVNGTLSCPQ